VSRAKYPTSAPEAYTRERARILQAFAVSLRTARGATPYSQEVLGRVARMHRTEVSLVERAQTEPRLLTILIFAGALGVPPGLLLDDLPVPQERRSPAYARRAND
jgi:transcriptional regulator with XRE-family HTH domain